MNHWNSVSTCRKAEQTSDKSCEGLFMYACYLQAIPTCDVIARRRRRLSLLVLCTCSLGGLPFEVMLPCLRLASWFRLEIEHMFAEVVHLCLIELRRENGVGGELEVL